MLGEGLEDEEDGEGISADACYAVGILCDYTRGRLRRERMLQKHSLWRQLLQQSYLQQV